MSDGGSGSRPDVAIADVFANLVVYLDWINFWVQEVYYASEHSNPNNNKLH